MSGPTDEQLRKIAEHLEGTCSLISSVLDKLELDFDPSDVEDRLLSLNVERCSGCDWWMESSDLVDADGEVVGCDQCRKKSEED